jgi:4-hydroxy-3-polyprenylbenzoate decarboxylase
VDVHLIVSPLGRRLLADECGVRQLEVQAILGRPSNHVQIHNFNDVGDVLASGSFLTDGMVVCPCSSNSLGAMATGISDNLITRAAQVTLKEGRRLIIVPREMPANAIDLENMLRLQRAGAIICPASPGFYMNPITVNDLVDFVAGKLLDLMQVPHDLGTRWTGQAPNPPAGGPSEHSAGM